MIRALIVPDMNHVFTGCNMICEANLPGIIREFTLADDRIVLSLIPCSPLTASKLVHTCANYENSSLIRASPRHMFSSHVTQRSSDHLILCVYYKKLKT